MTQSFVMKIQTVEPHISYAWNLLMAMYTLEEMGYVKKWRKFFDPNFWKKSVIISLIPGKNMLSIKIFGSSERVSHLLSQVRVALLVEVWEIFRLSALDVAPVTQQLLYFRLFSGVDVYLEEIKQEEK